MIRVRYQTRQQDWQALTQLAQRRIRARRADRRRRQGVIALIVVGALALVAGLPWLIWRGPYVLDAKYLDSKALANGSAALVTGLRTAAVAFVAALGAGIALLYTARTYRLTRRGQITDRFTKALEQLGSPEIYVRIGGILALEQIVQDAPEQAATDAARVLGHFIRHRAPKAAPPLAPATPDPAPASGAGPLPDQPAADVQTALTALTRAESRIHVDPRETLDLHGLHLAGADLNHADLTHAHLTDATLMEANLTGATLTKANLARATLTYANLDGATLTYANLDMATLAYAQLTGATLTYARLTGATLAEANLARATLTKANLARATLTKAILVGATLTDANLTGAMLTDANLYMATLTCAQLTGATLAYAQLAGATLTKANLDGALLTKAVLNGAMLTGANLHRVDLSSVVFFTPIQAISAMTDETTVMPPHLYVSVKPAPAS
ncbi:pentapeptide repeat-containing protein [Streptomyces caniferus]|uniref:pentapeptide repeat-containing protein n=1 Tax=Streptomyces caniferus TaxID=285557 RepID=UPI002E293A0C|nr:pentapeptide repeat-containing protein [Streptomyces caniferus]